MDLCKSGLLLKQFSSAVDDEYHILELMMMLDYPLVIDFVLEYIARNKQGEDILSWDMDMLCMV